MNKAKPTTWYTERDAYIRDALAGKNLDWTDGDRLFRAIQLETHAAVPPAQALLAIKRLIAQRIQHRAEEHADVMLENGRLNDDEYGNPRSTLA